MARQPLLVTLGDPNGLGPELFCRVFGPGSAVPGSVLALGPEAALHQAADALGLPRFWRSAARPEDALAASEGVFAHTPAGLAGLALTPGQATPEGGRSAGEALSLAARLMLEGRAGALVTCPLNKAMLMAAGYSFPGHTEFLAEAAGLGPDEVCMHLCGPKLRVSLVTTHPPLKDVPRLVTRERVERCLRQSDDLRRRLGLAAPIGVCGLNPHAGESGRIGSEEAEVITPAIEAARRAGIPADGPIPADTVFRRAVIGEFSLVLAMYHDQGLAPLKLLHFGEAVNVTLGLPFVRTSPDHGTGYDLVGTGRADPGSLAAAVELAARLAGNRE